jgi:hypothetical protein
VYVFPISSEDAPSTSFLHLVGRSGSQLGAALATAEEGAAGLWASAPTWGGLRRGALYRIDGATAEGVVDVDADGPPALRGARAGDRFGAAFAVADVDADGNTEGAAYIFFGPIATDGSETSMADADIVIEGADPLDQAGLVVGTLGDINGDNVNDIVVTASQHSGSPVTTRSKNGKVYVFYGGADLEAASAGSRPSGRVNPKAIEAMAPAQ